MIGIIAGIALAIGGHAGLQREVGKSIVSHMPTQQQVAQETRKISEGIAAGIAASRGGVVKTKQNRLVMSNQTKPALAIREIVDESEVSVIKVATAQVLRCGHNVGGSIGLNGSLTCNR